jgi:ABC-type multidrug transport system ATPase subunit
MPQHHAKTNTKKQQGRTSIFVAHRLSTAAQCDQIVVLERGRVAESGSHAALLERGGRYAEMWARQQASAVDGFYDGGGTSGEEEDGGGGKASPGGAAPAA